MHEIQWTPGVTLEAIEQQVIEKALVHFRGNKSATAKALGIAPRTLDARLDDYQEQAKEQRERDLEYRKDQQRRVDRLRGGPFIESLPEAATGYAVESASEVSSEQSVPVSERAEVQEVLSTKAAFGGVRRKIQ